MQIAVNDGIIASEQYQYYMMGKIIHNLKAEGITKQDVNFNLLWIT